jgi:hypothetical protein
MIRISRDNSLPISKYPQNSSKTLPIVSFAGPEQASKKLQQLKYDVVSGLIGGLLGI